MWALLLHEHLLDSLVMSSKLSASTAKVLAPQATCQSQRADSRHGVCLMETVLVDLWALGAAIVIVGIIAAAVAHRLAIAPIGRNVGHKRG